MSGMIYVKILFIPKKLLSWLLSIVYWVKNLWNLCNEMLC